MKIFHRYFVAALVGAALATAACSQREPASNRLVILHTNDTHSQIEPKSNGLGGVMRRMAIIDSIRGAERNVMLVDAGDAVQGTLYFYLYGGAVEQEVLNLMGLDEGILGNHEFDNGIDSLASILRLRNRKILCTNYITEGTPLDTLTVPYSIRQFNGKKIGFMGINIDPYGIIDEENTQGLGFMPIVETANATAQHLRTVEGADAVIAITHIGYNQHNRVGDSILATNSRGIDVIIGGHSHDIINPATEEGAARSRLNNLDGQQVLVVQTGKSGINLGKIVLNLDSLGMAAPQYELIPVDNRWDGRIDPRLQTLIDRYKVGVDSLMHVWVSTTEEALPDSSTQLLNFFSDFIMERGRELAPNVDLAIVNRGGLRASLPQGKVSKGHIINMVPFRNNITVLDVSGSDLKKIFDVMAATLGNGVSANVSAKYRRNGDKFTAEDILINGRPLNPNKTYRVATISYLANGGDYMEAFKNGTTVASSPNWIYDDILTYITTGPYANRPIAGSTVKRWAPAQ